MVIFGIVALWLTIGAISIGAYRLQLRRVQTLDRFIEATEMGPVPSDTVNQTASPTSTVPATPTRRLTRRWMMFPWLFGAGIAITAWWISGWPVQYVLAAGAVISLLLSQVESFFYTRQIATLERQLADSIDIMVGALSAGAAVGPAIESATVETDRPLKPYLQELSGRIRLGDEPAAVFRSLADRVPLETFLLFSSSMAVHYEVGGRLAPTLATVGRTIRDRIDVTRRIQSNIAQSQFSTIAIIGLIYMVAVIVWRNGPEPMREFVTSTIGSWAVAGSIILQAAGIVWMNLISKPKF